MIIRDEQFRVLSESYHARRRNHILKKLREEYGFLCQECSDEEALDKVDAAMEDARTLGIATDEDTIRLAALAFLPEDLRNDPLIASVLVRVLNNESWEPRKRLDFLHKHILSRVALTPSRH